MIRKYVRLRHPEIIGIYYHDADTYCENLDGKGGNLIIMMPLKGKEAGPRQDAEGMEAQERAKQGRRTLL